jgi:hypothetical protein
VADAGAARLARRWARCRDWTRQRGGFLQLVAEGDDGSRGHLARAAFEDHARRGAFAVDRLVGGIVDREHRAIERDAREQAARTRPRPDLRLELAIRRRRRIAAERTRGTPASAPRVNLPLTIDSEPAVAAEHQHDVRRLHAGLEADAAAGEADERRVGPGAVGILHRQQPMAATTADDQAGLDGIGDDHDRPGLVEQLVGDRRSRGWPGCR